MPFYAFTNFNEENATYTGFRMVEANWELGENETLVEADSLDGYSEAIPPPPPLSIDDKRIILMEQFKGLPELTRRAFKQTALDVEGFLRLEDINNAIFFLEQAQLEPNADTVLIQNMINFLGED
jgi:hypothetical protein